MNMFARFDENPAMTLQDIKETKPYGRTDGRMDTRRDVRSILNIGPVYKGPFIRGQVSEIMGQFSSKLAR